MSFSKPAVKRKVGDEHRQFQEKWGMQYFFVEHRGTPTCPICTEKVALHKEYNLKCHYSARHAEEYAKYQGDDRANRVANLKTCLLRQQDFFKKATKENTVAVEASYVVSEMIAKAGKPFTEGEFVKKCILQAASIVCPEKKGQFSNISLSANTVAERISDLSRTFMINCVRKPNASMHTQSLLMRAQTSLTLPSSQCMSVVLMTILK